MLTLNLVLVKIEFLLSTSGRQWVSRLRYTWRTTTHADWLKSIALVFVCVLGSKALYCLSWYSQNLCFTVWVIWSVLESRSMDDVITIRSDNSKITTIAQMFIFKWSFLSRWSVFAGAFCFPNLDNHPFVFSKFMRWSARTKDEIHF